MYNKMTPTLIRVEIATHILLALGVFGSLASIKRSYHGAFNSKAITFLM
jgi:hypothetical protein